MRLPRSAKVRWSLGISIFSWSWIFLFALSIFAVRPEAGGLNYFYFGTGAIPWLVLIAVVGASVTWPVLWAVMSIGDALLHVLARALRRFKGLPSRRKFAIATALFIVLGAAAVPTIAYLAALLSRPSEAAQMEAEALRLAGGHPPDRCEGAPMPPSQSTGPSRQLVGVPPVWLQFGTIGTITRRSEDLVLTGLGTVLMKGVRTPGGDARMLPTFWAVPDGYADTVVVRIIETPSGQSVLALGNSFDGRRGGNLSNGYSTHVVHFAIPRAGCYIVEAVWPGGSWRAPLAAGQ
ncbi:MAG TPA: hypothetical protein VGS01_03875 [Candidatus Limnocylindria bacterium]|nr:hypothetical protein [Candidatus Limnocylindria bacterium]